MTIKVDVLRSGVRMRQGRVFCRGGFGGRTLKVLSHRLEAGRATCSWRLPAATRGKIVSGTLVVRQGNLRAQAPFRARIT